MKDEKKAPKLRFKGFTDDWEQCKLGQLFNQEVQYIDPKAENVPLWSLTVADGLVEKTDRYNREFLVKKNDKFKLVKDNWFTYNPMNMTLGALDVNELGQDIAVSGYYVTMSLDNQFNRTFLKTWMKSDKAIGLFKLYATGSLIEKQRVQFGTLSEIPSKFPKYEEQTQIGQFFDSLDNLIAANQRKSANLKELKQGYLQKMFPKNGAKVPELRFAGFADDWEERKLRDLLNKNSEKNENLSVINVESVSNKTGFTKQTDQFEDYSVASANLSNYYVIREKQFAYNPSRINVGSIAYKDLGDEISVVSPLYVSFSTKKVLNDGFLWNWFKTASFDAQRQRLSEGGVRDILSFNQLSEMNTMFPTYPEQEKIASFFKQLDDTIALHQRKLEKLQELKKGYLQKMFC